MLSNQFTTQRIAFTAEIKNKNLLHIIFSRNFLPYPTKKLWNSHLVSAIVL